MAGFRTKMYGYRMNRATFALWMVTMIVAYAVIIAFDARPPGIEVISSFVIIPRLHDLGRSGWWFLLIVAAEILAVIVGVVSAGGVAGVSVAAVAFILIFLLSVAVLGMIPGQAQPNRWGDPPPRGIHGPTRRPASAS